MSENDGRICNTEIHVSWMTTLHTYLLTSGNLLEGEFEASQGTRFAPNFLIIDKNYIDEDTQTPYIKCVATPETEKEVDEDVEACHKKHDL